MLARCAVGAGAISQFNLAAVEVLLELVPLIGRRRSVLFDRAHGPTASQVFLRVAYDTDCSSTTRSRTLKEPTAHSAALTRATYGMYEALGLQRARVRALALRAEGLDPAEQASYQLTFDPLDEKARRIEEVADRARAKFGPHAVMPGALAA
jgi:hypothetical protein